MRASNCCLHPASYRAGDGARTRDIKLGRLALYQLSYSRISVPAEAHVVAVEPAALHRRSSHLPPATCNLQFSGGGRIRTFEGISRQIYSLLPLATWVPHRIHPTRRQDSVRNTTNIAPRADGENRTRDRPITNRVLYQLSYVSETTSCASIEG